MDWFLYDNGLRHERVKNLQKQYNTLKISLLFNKFANFTGNELLGLRIVKIKNAIFSNRH